MEHTRPLRSVFFTLAFALAGVMPVLAQDAFDVTVVLRSPFDAGVVRAAARGARRALERPECRRVFQDFRDGQGRTLQESLDAAQQTPAAYLELILFRSGERLPACARDGVLAVTAVRSRVVFVCPAFVRATLRDAFLARSVLIHEMLHSLGLGEGGRDPDSAHITSRVQARCYGG